jgi:hypothetical protein
MERLLGKYTEQKASTEISVNELDSTLGSSKWNIIFSALWPKRR